VRIIEHKENDTLKGHNTFLRNRDNMLGKQEKAPTDIIKLYITLGKVYRLKTLLDYMWKMPNKAGEEVFLIHW
jgi:hypothetical protein